MKRTLIAIGMVIIAMTIGLYANDDEIIQFKDPRFKYSMVNHTEWYSEHRVDLNEDGEISYAEADSFQYVLYFWTNIKDFSDIRHFKNASGISFISGIEFDTLDLSGMKNFIGLYFRDVGATKYIYLDSCTSLESIIAEGGGDNRIKSISLKGCSNLEVLNLRYNSLEQINLNDCLNLRKVELQGNRLTELDTKNLDNLEKISISYNDIKNVDVSNNLKLKVFSCSKGMIEELNLENNSELEEVWLYKNKNLHSLNIANKNNHKIDFLHLNNNPDLKCITVDDPTYVYTNWFSDTTHYKFDPWVTFSTDCTSCMQEDDNLVKIYPNPAEDFLYIERLDDEETDIIIMDITGKVCIKQHLEYNQKQVKIDISNLTRGKYVTDLDSTIDYFIKK